MAGTRSLSCCRHFKTGSQQAAPVLGFYDYIILVQRKRVMGTHEATVPDVSIYFTFSLCSLVLSQMFHREHVLLWQQYSVIVNTSTLINTDMSVKWYTDKGQEGATPHTLAACIPLGGLCWSCSLLWAC